MPQLAAFPKAYMNALCKDGTMKVSEWIDIACRLDIDGLEWYAGFLEMENADNWKIFRRQVEDNGKVIPMMCCSPDFTHPDITLIIENHYKDDFWTYPEFAQKMDVFCALVDKINHPFFGVNYDPSNTYLAGEDPLELLKRVVHRVVTMHASDRYLKEGTLEDLRNEEGGAVGYAKRLSHGEIGKGLNDYDAIFTLLKKQNFNGWISIEDGVDGIEQLERSVLFLRKKMKEYFS